MAAAPLSPAALHFLEAARVGHLATVDAQGRPAVVPICYQVEGTRLFTPIDAKPKREDWRGLQRVRNLLAQPSVAVVVDRWDEDWTRLGWVHLRGRAALVESGALHARGLTRRASTLSGASQGALHARGLTLLRAKYAQYRAMALESRPLIVIEIESARHWGDLTPPPAFVS